MKRYHKKIFFPHIKELENFNSNLNKTNFKYSLHCIDRIKSQILSESNITELLFKIKNLTLDYSNIFEYYYENEIKKACYRIPYTTNNDIILVLSKDKNIITIYLNKKSDNHITLKKELYNIN